MFTNSEQILQKIYESQQEIIGLLKWQCNFLRGQRPPPTPDTDFASDDASVAQVVQEQQPQLHPQGEVAPQDIAPEVEVQEKEEVMQQGNAGEPEHCTKLGEDFYQLEDCPAPPPQPRTQSAVPQKRKIRIVFKDRKDRHRGSTSFLTAPTDMKHKKLKSVADIYDDFVDIENDSDEEYVP